MILWMSQSRSWVVTIQRRRSDSFALNSCASKVTKLYKNMRLFINCIIAMFIAIMPCFAYDIATPSIIGDNMVVNRHSSAKIWGWDKAGKKVAIVASWNPTDTVRVMCDSNSRFEADIATPGAGGPYTIEIMGTGKKRVIRNVMSGEVWLCGGQSNMQMSMSSLFGTKVDYKAEFAKIDNPNIRTFFVPLKASSSPQEDCGGEWNECHADIMGDVSLAAYFFAERLQSELGVPVGIVMSSWGGTNAEVWVSEEAAATNGDVELSAKAMAPKTWKPIKTASLYNSMINPLVPFRFSGALWYQGESNVVDPRYYDSSMRTLIDCWRSDFGTDMPFYFAQIAPYDYKGESLNKSAYLREQQLLTSTYENCGMIVINDLVHDYKNIHPKDKRSVGYRFAEMAMGRLYGVEGTNCVYPTVESVEIKGNKAILKISESVKQISKEQSGFKIAGRDGNFVDAQIKIKGDMITVSAKGVSKPQYVRYLFDDGSTCAIKGAESELPLTPFRNDTIEVSK